MTFPTTMASKSVNWFELYIFATLLVFFAIVFPTESVAGHWYSTHNPNCGQSGIACAMEDWEAYWANGPEDVSLDNCHYNYGINGNVSTATCDGYTPGGFYRGGMAMLSCDTGELSTSTGCVKNFTPDHDPDCRSLAANPVDTRSGMKVESRTDFATKGESPLSFVRYYASDRAALGGYRPSRLGRGWSSNFDSSLYQYPVTNGWVGILLPSGQTFFFQYDNSTHLWVQNYFRKSINWLSSGVRGRAANLTQDSTTQVFTLTLDGTQWAYSPDGKLQSITYQNGYSQSLTYDSNGLNTLVTDTFGRTLQFSYSAQNLLTSITVPGGQVYQYSYKEAWDASVPYPPDSNSMASEFWTLEYMIEPDGTSSTTDNPRIRYHYENANFRFALTGITDQKGVRYATWNYDSDGRVISSEHAGGAEHYTFSYDDVANTVTVTNPLSKTAIYHFEKDDRSLNRLIQIEGQASSHCVASDSYTAYNTSNYVTDETDAEGRVTHYTRDSRGNPTTITRAYGTGSAQTDSYTWHSTLNVPTQVVKPGLTTNYTWTNGQLTELSEADTSTTTVPYSTNGQTRTWTFSYTTGGLVSSIDGPLAGSGDTLSYTYNSSGFVETITNQVGQISTVTAWSNRGQPTSISDANSVSWSLTYDDVGRVNTITVDPAGVSAETAFDYNAVGDVTKITRPNGAYLQYTYDDARRITKVEDNTGAYVEYDRDAVGNATARRVKDSGGTLLLTQTATFDELGRLLTFVGASSQTWTHGYDKTDNRVSITDPRSNVFGWTFDPLNRLISTTDEDSNAVTLTRNGKDEVTNYSDPRSLDTSYVRNGFGEVIQRTSPDSGTTVYTFNAIGKPTQITDGRGVVTNLTYDNAGRLLTKEYPAATTENVNYTWDSTTGGNKGIGRVTKIQDASGSVEWTYNALGQVTQEKKTTGSVVYTVDYGYDLDGNVTQITYPSGRTVSYSRGSTGLVTGVTTKKDSGSSPVTLASSVSYQSFGPLQTLTYGNGLILWKIFNEDYGLDQLIVEQGSYTIINYAYTRWNEDFDITNVWDNLVSARSESYVYTPNHRLQNVYGDWGTQTYWQDGVGNRTGDIFEDGTTTTTKVLGYAYNNNLVGSIDEGSTTLRTMDYDGGGNIITDTRETTVYHYRYNQRGRMDRLTVGSTIKADYGYDGLERMSIRTTQNMTPAATTHYIYDRAGRLIAEASGTGTIQREYVWIDDMPLALVADIDTATPKLWYVHPDHLNRPVKMTDDTQAVVWDAYYTTYGEVQSITGSASNNLRFPGQYFLVESGLHYNWHRHYDPSLGRYIQPDPNAEVQATMPVNLDGSSLIARDNLSGGSQLTQSMSGSGDYNTQIGAELPAFVDGPSIYQYARSAPAMLVDPMGLCRQGDVMCQIATRNAGLPRVWSEPTDSSIDNCVAELKAALVLGCLGGNMAVPGTFAVCNAITTPIAAKMCRQKKSCSKF